MTPRRSQRTHDVRTRSRIRFRRPDCGNSLIESRPPLCDARLRWCCVTWRGGRSCRVRSFSSRAWLRPARHSSPRSTTKTRPRWNLAFVARAAGKLYVESQLVPRLAAEVSDKEPSKASRGFQRPRDRGTAFSQLPQRTPRRIFSGRAHGMHTASTVVINVIR